MADGPLAVVLAAGRGTRMRSALPKVLHPVVGRPLILHVVDTARAAFGDRRPVVVVSPDQPAVRQLLEPICDVVEQAVPRGTGDALRSVPAPLRGIDPVVVLSGDVPLLRAATLRRLLARHAASGAACTLLTAVPADPAGLGRIVRHADGRVARIVEERDLPAGTDPPAECNAGVYAFEAARLWPALDQLGDDNAQQEHYLTEVIEMLAGRVEAVMVDDPAEAMGVNDRRQLAAAGAALRERILDELMLAGVTVEDPTSTYVELGVRVGSDSVVLPMTHLRGGTVLGSGCVVGPMAQLDDVVCGDRVRIGASVIEQSRLGDDVVVGHFNRVRPGTSLGDGAYLGTHAEVKNSVVGPRSRVSHFACVLDSDVGSDVNVGAGTVTCNFDGFDKHRTRVGDGTFLGTDSTLVAPLRIGSDAYTAAGSVVTGDVPGGALAVGRARQRNVAGWVERRRRRRAGAGAEPA